MNTVKHIRTLFHAWLLLGICAWSMLGSPLHVFLSDCTHLHWQMPQEHASNEASHAHEVLAPLTDAQVAATCFLGDFPLPNMLEASAYAYDLATPSYTVLASQIAVDQLLANPIHAAHTLRGPPASLTA